MENIDEPKETENILNEFEDKDMKIDKLEKELDLLKKSFAVEKMLLKEGAKNTTAVRALIDINYDDEDFLEKVNKKILELKENADTAFLFEADDNKFRGIETIKSQKYEKNNKTLKDGIKNYFNI